MCDYLFTTEAVILTVEKYYSILHFHYSIYSTYRRGFALFEKVELLMAKHFLDLYMK